MTSTAVILGTSRANGNTQQLVDLFVHNKNNVDVFDLTNYNFSFYDYKHKNRDDDFASLMTQLLTYDQLIFATPVYWYCMSGQMKQFFDRFSDLLTVDKSAGRLLRGKRCAVLATGSDKIAEPCFEQAFIATAGYLGMQYQGMLYCSCEDTFDEKQHQLYVQQFVKNITL